MGLDVRRPDTHVYETFLLWSLHGLRLLIYDNYTVYSNKAVADGAISFHIDHLVNGRVSKFAYGTNFMEYYDSSNPEHAVRRNTAFRDITGSIMISGLFDVILPKVISLLSFRSHRGLLWSLGNRERKWPKHKNSIKHMGNSQVTQRIWTSSTPGLSATEERRK